MGFFVPAWINTRLDLESRIEYILFVATTTIHVPDDLLAMIDRAAKSRGTSRNRFILEACRDSLSRNGGEWPMELFDARGTADDRALLAQATEELERTVMAARRNRGAVLL